MARRSRRTVLRLLVILLAGVVLLPVLAVIAALVFVDPNTWRPEIEAAVQNATGRAARIGHVTFVPSLVPTLGASDLALANLPGGSRPDMATVARAELKLALLPLLAGRVEIARLLLIRPDILLERDPGGQPNWRLKAATAGAGQAGPAAPEATPPAGGRPLVAVRSLVVRSLRIEDGVLTVRGKGAAMPTRLDLRVLAGEADGLNSPVSITAEGSWAGQTLALTAEIGPLSRLLADGAEAPWPVKATLETPGARVAVTGTLTLPVERGAYTFAVEGAAVNLSALDGLVGTHLPPLRQVAFAARVADAGRLPSDPARPATGGPEVTGLVVRAGASDLDALSPGLKLVHAELSAGAVGEPVRAEAAGSLRGAALRATASLGPLVALLPDPPSPGPYPVELAAEAAGATLAVKGNIGTPALFGGTAVTSGPALFSAIDLAVTGRIPDLSALSPLAGVALPALRPVTLDARVTDLGAKPGLSVRGLAVTTPNADVSGEISLGLAARPAVQARLSARRIDLDAILAAMPPPLAIPAGGQGASAPPASPAPAAPTPGGRVRLIPDGKLPFPALDQADADLHLTIGEFRGLGGSWRDLVGRLVLQDGKLTLDPVSATLPGGRLELRLTADARAVPPPVALTLRGPGLALKPLLAALRLPDDASGVADIDADLHGAGDTPQALAAGLGGRLGLAMTDGELDNRLLGNTVGALLSGVQLTAAQQIAGAQMPAEVLGLGRPGRTRIRCLALRADAEAGLANVSTLLLDTGRILVHGAGTINLRDETLALRLRPTLRVGPSLVLPVRVTGSLLGPKFASDPGASLGAAAGLLGGLPALRGTPLGALAPGATADHGGDSCGPALAAARGGPRQAPASAAPKPPGPADLLRGLLQR